MTWLIDTNVLLRAAQPNHSQHATAVEAIAALRLRGETLRAAPQNLYEFWVVATRPVVNNGLGLSIEEARDELSKLDRLYRPLEETSEVYAAWKRILNSVEIKGQLGHDARLVAVM